MDDRRTPEEWLQTDEYKDIIILDPDGWDRKNFDEDWRRPLTYDEFRDKVVVSTIVPRGAGWD